MHVNAPWGVQIKTAVNTTPRGVLKGKRGEEKQEKKCGPSANSTFLCIKIEF